MTLRKNGLHLHCASFLGDSVSSHYDSVIWKMVLKGLLGGDTGKSSVHNCSGLSGDRASIQNERLS